MGTVSVWLSEEIDKEFIAFCEKSQKTPSEVLKNVINDILKTTRTPEALEKERLIKEIHFMLENNESEGLVKQAIKRFSEKYGELTITRKIIK